MKKWKKCRLQATALAFVCALAGVPVFAADALQPAAPGVEITTEQLVTILAEGKVPVIDVRPEKEYAMSRIPGAANIFETEIERMVAACPDTSRGPVLYCNGPHCHKTGRVAEQLAKRGYGNILKYQLGLPVWRAYGNTAEIGLEGLRLIASKDGTAVLVDARSPEEYKAGTVKGAVNISKAEEIDAANKDGRLPYTDHGTRIVVIGKTVAQARALAEVIAKRAYWNSGYLAATYDEVAKAGL